MVFPLKKKNKDNKYEFENKNFKKFKSMLSKVKLVAKNVIYLKGWSNENLDKKFN